MSRGISSGIEYQVPWIHDVIGDAEALVVRGRHRSIEDLAGKRIATTVRLDRPLQPAGRPRGRRPDRRRRGPGRPEPDDIYAAWTTGDIDGAYAWNPNLAKIIDEGGKTLITSADLAAEGKTTYDLAVVRSGFAEDYPDAVEIWVEAQDRAVALIQDDPEAAGELIAVELNITPEEAVAQLGDLVFVRASDQIGADYLAVAWPRTSSRQPSSTSRSARSTR